MKKYFIFIFIIYFSNEGFSQSLIKKNIFLRSNFGMDTMYDGASFRIFGITSALSAPPVIPAPVIYCNEGDSVVLNALSISQTDHHTVHLHGLDVDTRNDGDPATSFYLSHMQDTTYSFKAKHAGSYLYHCHVGDVAHVQMGMYGMIVVRAKGGANQIYTNGPDYSKAYNWLTSEIDKSWHDTIPVHDPKTGMMKIPKYLPDYFLINGKSEWELGKDTSIAVYAKQNEPILLHLANIGFYNNRYIFPSHLHAVIYMSDGRKLPSPMQTDSLLVAPGERYDVLVTPSEQGRDSIHVSYLNMNTSVVENSQYIPIEVTGVYSNVMSDKKENKILVFPNPGHGVFTVSGIGDKAFLELYSFDGKFIQQTEIADKGNLDIHEFPAGIYFLRIHFQGNSEIVKLIRMD